MRPGGTCWVGCADGVEAEVEDDLSGAVALAEDCGGEVVVLRVTTEDEVGARLVNVVDVVVGEVMVVLKAVDLGGSSSAICHLSKTK